MSIYLHHGVFFYELIVAGRERQVPVYVQRTNKRKNPERVHSIYLYIYQTKQKKKNILLLCHILL